MLFRRLPFTRTVCRSGVIFRCRGCCLKQQPLLLLRLVLLFTSRPQCNSLQVIFHCQLGCWQYTPFLLRRSSVVSPAFIFIYRRTSSIWSCWLEPAQVYPRSKHFEQRFCTSVGHFSPIAQEFGEHGLDHAPETNCLYCPHLLFHVLWCLVQNYPETKTFILWSLGLRRKQ